MNRIVRLLGLALGLLIASIHPAGATPLSSSFTYQGQLSLSGTPVTGTADFRFRLYDASTAGSQQGVQVIRTAVDVSGGIFTVSLDFGVEVFPGEARWLEVDVRSPAGGGTYETLGTRQALTATPYSLQTRGIFVDAAGNVGVATAGGTARMTVKNTGRVGIGTDTPDAPLHVAGTDANMAVFESSNETVLRLRLDNTATGGRQWDLISTADASGIGGGKFALRDKDGLTMFVVDSTGNMGIGPGVQPSAVNLLKVGGDMEVDVLQINGGSDIAEPFDISESERVRPGMVVCIDPENPSALRLSTRAYDGTVAGVVSGAGGVNPGMMLRQAGTPADGTHPVALTGRVYCWVDADAGGAVHPGDLLTTSDTPGHAMRARDRRRAGGAVLGKAMTSLERGRGLVLVLVNLQ